MERLNRHGLPVIARQPRSEQARKNQDIVEWNDTNEHLMRRAAINYRREFGYQRPTQQQQSNSNAS
jgi:hypothetical protein